MATYLKWPMQLGPDGRFVVARTPDEVWAGRVSQVLCARMGERVMRDDYGTNLVASLFENALIQPEESVREALKKWLPHIKVESVSVNQVQDTYEVEVIYTTPDSSLLTTTVGIESPHE
jgi:phage baseplate assembly protein W